MITIKVIDLGYCMARLNKANKAIPAIMIIQPGSESSEDYSFEPSQTVRIWSDVDARKLRDALNEFFLTEEE